MGSSSMEERAMTHPEGASLMYYQNCVCENVDEITAIPGAVSHSDHEPVLPPGPVMDPVG